MQRKYTVRFDVEIVAESEEQAIQFATERVEVGKAEVIVDDVGCGECDATGTVTFANSPDSQDCKACAGTGA